MFVDKNKYLKYNIFLLLIKDYDFFYILIDKSYYVVKD